MAVSPISSRASFVFPTSGRESSISASVSSYAGSKGLDTKTCRNIDQMISCIRGGDHAAAAWQWDMVQHEINVMMKEIHSKAKTQHTVAWSYALRLLAFADEITKLQLSPHKLFVVLRLHEVLNADFFVILQWHPEEFSLAKYNHTLQKLREDVFLMLRELKVLIHKSASRSVPEGGGVHEGTSYVINYISLLLHYRSSVSFILAHNDGTRDNGMDSLQHIVQDLITCLKSMLNTAAEAYDSGGLQCFFLMNNLHYTVQQVEGLHLSPLLGHSWAQVHKGFIQQFMETYVDLSWGPVLSCLSTRKSMIGRCFSQTSNTVRFALQFDSTYHNQMHWKVEDPQLREEVRRAVCDRVIPAYRAHFGWCRKVQGLYDWYNPELLEVQLMQLFEGETN